MNLLYKFIRFFHKKYYVVFLYSTENGKQFYGWEIIWNIKYKNISDIYLDLKKQMNIYENHLC